MGTQRTIRTLSLRAARVVAVALLGCTPALSHATAQERITEQDRELRQLDQQTRARVRALLQTAARSARVSVQPGDFVYLSRNDVLLVNSAIAGADSMEIGAFRRGVNLLFTYVGTPPASTIPPGFYTIRVTGVPGSAQAQFVRADGRVAAALPATLTPAEPGSGGVGFKLLSASVFEGGCIVDIHTRKWVIRIGIRVDPA